MHLSNLHVEAVHLLQAVQSCCVFLGDCAGVQMTKHQSVDFREPLRRAAGGGGLELNRIEQKRQKERQKVENKNISVKKGSLKPTCALRLSNPPSFHSHYKHYSNVVAFKGTNLE